MIFPNAYRVLASPLLSSVIYAACNVVGRGIQCLVMMLLAGSCAVSEYSKIGMLLALQQLVVLICQGGIIEAVLGHYHSKSHAGGQDILRRQAFHQVDGRGVALLVVSLIVFIAFVITYPGQATSLTGFAFVAVSGFLLARLRLQSQFRQFSECHQLAAILQAIPPALAYVIGFIVAQNAHQPSTMFLIGSTVALIPWVAFQYWKMPIVSVSLPVDEALGHSVRRRSLSFWAIHGLGWLSGVGTTIIINLLLRDQDVADYTLSLTVMSAVVLMLDSISQVWSPQILRLLHDDDPRLAQNMNDTVTDIQMVVVGLTTTALIIAIPLLTGVFTSLAAYRHLGSYISIMGAGYIFLGGYYRCHPYFVHHHRGSSFLRIILTTSVVGTAVWAVAMSIFGGLGVYVGFCIAMAIRGICVQTYARRMWGVRARGFSTLLGLMPIAAVSCWQHYSIICTNYVFVIGAIAAMSYMFVVWSYCGTKAVRISICSRI